MTTAETYEALFTPEELADSLMSIIFDNKGALVKQHTTPNGDISVTIIFDDNSVLTLNKTKEK